MINKLRKGEHQRAHTGQFAVDRTNLFIGRVELHNEEDWNQPNAGLMNLSAGLDVAGQAGLTNMASGGNAGPQCVGVDRRYDEATGLGIYTYTFEGIATVHNKKWFEFELEFTTTQEPIEVHPNFAELNRIYGPYDAINRIWPQYISAQSQAVGLAAKGTEQGAIINPMHGISSFYLPGLTYRLSYTDTDIRKEVITGIGSLQEPALPVGGQFEGIGLILHSFGGNRNWLKMAPKVRQHGSCISITEEYMLSGYKGWTPDIYGEDALKGRTL